MQRFKNILFVADGSQGEETVLARAADLAHANGGELTVFDSVEVDDFAPTDPALGSAMNYWREAHLEERLKELESLGETAASKYPSLRITAKVQTGNTARAAIRTAVTDRHDLVMKAPQGGSGRLRLLFGSTDQKLMRKCPCPVWIVRPTGSTSFQRILAAVEIDPNEPEAELLARQIMELSVSLATSEGSELHVVHAWHLAGEVKLRSGRIEMNTVESVLSDMEAAHRSALDALGEAYPYDKLETHLIKGDAGDVISEFVEKMDIDLVVIGTVGRTGVPGLLIGNTAEQVLSSVDCSVLTLKPEGFETPLAV